MKVKFLETIKKKWLRDKFLTVLLVVVILLAYLGISYWVNNTTFNDIDLTDSKIYSLSD